MEAGQSVSIPSPPPGEYPVFCTVHWDAADEQGMVWIRQSLAADAARRNVEEGFTLIEGDPTSAVRAFQTALSSDALDFVETEREKARAGIAIARISTAFALAEPILSAPRRQGSAGIRSIAENLVAGLMDARRRLFGLKEIDSLQFHVPKLQLQLGDAGDLVFDLSGDYQALEVRFLSAIVGLLDGVVQMVMAHNLDVPLDPAFLDALSAVSFQEPGDIAKVRGLGAVLERNPQLLTLETPVRFASARRIWIQAMDALLGADGRVFVDGLNAGLTTVSDPPRPIAVIDVNASGRVDEGDLLKLPGVGNIRLSAELLGNMNALPMFLEKVRASIQGEPLTRVTMADLNIPLAFMGLNPLTDFMAVDLGALFRKPVSARDLLPVRYESKGSIVLAVEGEIAESNEILATIRVTPEFFESLKVGDAPHFQGLEVDGVRYELPADGISPSSGDPSELVPYYAFRDPTFGGMLFIAPGSFGSVFGEIVSICEVDAEGFCPASLGPLNAILAYFDAIADL
ncbi:MAG: hypothetical protein HYT87_08640 [Nitrospirae bacterium]|nr:hypothetical protein [Nitrospirota bacterium]